MVYEVFTVSACELEDVVDGIIYGVSVSTLLAEHADHMNCGGCLNMPSFKMEVVSLSESRSSMSCGHWTS